MKRYRLEFRLVALIVVVLTTAYKNPQNLTRNLPDTHGDSVLFTPNLKEGWDVYSSYMNQDTPDSVDFELILKRATGQVKGSKEQLVGTITNKLFLPKEDQKANYSLLPGNTWYILIKKNGDCYLAQVKGSGIQKSNLPGNPDIIPIKVRFKNN